MENNIKLTINGIEVEYIVVDNLDNGNIQVLSDCKDEGDDIRVTDGKINGRGTVYYKQDKKILIGNFVNGELEGKGKEYNEKGKLIYEGEFKNGKREGKGKEYYKNGNIKYEGKFKNGKYDGKGKFYYRGGEGYGGRIKFDGNFSNGKREGKGKQYYEYGKKIKYEGEFKNDQRNGEGKEYYEDGKIKYEGEYLNNERDGGGKEYNKNGDLIFKGLYSCGYQKQGKLALEEGYYFDGNFCNGYPNLGELYVCEYTGDKEDSKYDYEYGSYWGGHFNSHTRTNLTDIEEEQPRYEPVQVTKRTEFSIFRYPDLSNELDYYCFPDSKKSFLSTKYISENMEKYYSDNRRILLERKKPLAKNDEVELTINGATETYTVTRIVKTNSGKKIIGLKRKDGTEIFYNAYKKLFYTNCNLDKETCICSGERVCIYNNKGRNYYIGGIDNKGLWKVLS